MAGILSKGITFEIYEYNTLSNQSVWPTDGKGLITGLMEIPDLGGTPEKVDVTTLADSSRKYINGLADYGDLGFKFLYDNSNEDSNYRVLEQICREVGPEFNAVAKVTLTFPDGTMFKFDCLPAITIDGAGVNSALTFTLNCALQSDIEVTHPAGE